MSNKQESPKSKPDLSISIFEQLTLPLRDGHTTTSEASSSGQINITEAISSTDPTTEINVSQIKLHLETIY